MRRRGFSIAEVLVAAVLLAVAGAAFVQALATSGTANVKQTLASTARRLLQQSLEQVQSGGGIPSSGTQGPLTVTVTTSAAPTPTLIPSSGLTTNGVGTLTRVTIVITGSDGSVLATGTTVTPPGAPPAYNDSTVAQQRANSLAQNVQTFYNAHGCYPDGQGVWGAIPPGLPSYLTTVYPSTAIYEAVGQNWYGVSPGQQAYYVYVVVLGNSGQYMTAYAVYGQWVPTC